MFPGQRRITAAFGYGAPHSSARGTLTLPICTLPSAHYGLVRLPGLVRGGRATLAFTARTGAGCSPVEFGISRVPCRMPIYMPRVYDSDVPTRLSPYRFVPFCFPHQSTRSAHATGDFGAPYRACIHLCESTTGHLAMPGLSLEGRGGRLTLPRRGLTPPTSCRLVSALSDCPPLSLSPPRPTEKEPTVAGAFVRYQNN